MGSYFQGSDFVYLKKSFLYFCQFFIQRSLWERIFCSKKCENWWANRMKLNCSFSSSIKLNSDYDCSQAYKLFISMLNANKVKSSEKYTQ